MTMQDRPSGGPASTPGSGAGVSRPNPSQSTTPGTDGPNRSVEEERSGIGQMKDRLTEQVQPATEQVQEKTGQAFSQVREQATTRLDAQKDRAADGLKQAAQAIRQTGQQMRQQNEGAPLADYTSQAAEKVERFASFLEERDTKQIVSETERLARQNPALFIGSAFALGLAVARFFRSSAPPTNDGGRYGSGMSSQRMTPSATFPMQPATYPSSAPSSTTTRVPTAPTEANPTGVTASPSAGTSSGQSGQYSPGSSPASSSTDRG